MFIVYCVLLLTQTSLSLLSFFLPSDALWARLAAEAKKKEEEGKNKETDGDGDGKKGEKEKKEKKKEKKKRKKRKNAPLVTHVNARAGKKMHGATAL